MNQVSSTKEQVPSKKHTDLSERFLIFSEDIINLAKNLQADFISRPIITQLVRSATSVGANYSEAQNAISRKDFRNKIYIAKKEAQESGYWLHMLEKCFREDSSEIQNIASECQEIILILQAISNKLEKS